MFAFVCLAFCGGGEHSADALLAKKRAARSGAADSDPS